MPSAFEEAMAFGKSVEDQVRRIIDELGEKGAIQPEQEKAAIDLFGGLRGREFQPDFLMQGPKSTVMVEAKSRPAMINDVFRLKQARG